MAGNDASGTVHSATDGGIAGSHPALADAGVLVGPSAAKEQNLVTAGLIPVACWRVDDVRFDFDSSFVLPAVAEEITALAKLREAHKKPVVPRTDPKMPQFIFPPLSIFGHADPVGQDDYNKILSGRRAAAIYGMLTRRDEVWEDLYSNKGVFTGPAAGDKWGPRAIQTMLTELGFPPGNNDDQSGSDTTSAVRAFQSSQGLAADGDPGHETRKKLFLAYMDKLCGADFKLDKEDDFLARGEDSAGKGDFQGCGEFNPGLIFSDQQNQDFEQDKDKTARNEANAPNRRVMVLLFRRGSKVLAAKWPCPKAKEGVAGCKKRFWSDGEKRRTNRLPDQERKFEDTKDTFACRFYQRLTTGSPCERRIIVDGWIIRIEKAQGLDRNDTVTLESKPVGYHGVVSAAHATDTGEFLDFVFPQGPESDYDVSVTIAGTAYQAWLRLHLPGKGQGLEPPTMQYGPNEEEPDVYAHASPVSGRPVVVEGDA